MRERIKAHRKWSKSPILLFCLLNTASTNKLPPKGLSLDELPNLYQRRTKYKSEDEFLTNNLSDILCGLHDRCFGVEEQSGSLARGQKTNNMAALVALLTNKSRRTLDMAVYQRRIFSVKRMLVRLTEKIT